MNNPTIPKLLPILGDFLANLGENSPFSLNVKDIDTQKYCMNNAVCATMWGLPELVGMTTREVLGRVSNFTNLERELEKSAALEQQVVRDCRQGARIQTAIVWDGSVHIRQLLVTPVIGLNQKTVAIVTTAHEKTQQTNLLRLFNIYRHYYPNKVQAVEKFSSYLHLERYFSHSLCCAELRTLLAMAENAQYKRTAQALKVSPKTVASYLSATKDKLKPDFYIQDVLIQLRKFYQWKL